MSRWIGRVGVGRQGKSWVICGHSDQMLVGAGLCISLPAGMPLGAGVGDKGTAQLRAAEQDWGTEMGTGQKSRAWGRAASRPQEDRPGGCLTPKSRSELSPLTSLHRDFSNNGTSQW